MGKKGQAHVEFIISFVIFISFVAFLFFLLNPFGQSNETLRIGVYNRDVVITHVSREVGHLSVFVNQSDDCFDLDAVTDDYGDRFVVVPDADNSRRYGVYFSDIFSLGSIPCSNNPHRNYTFGSYREEVFVVEEVLTSLASAYDSHYGDLRSELNIRGDFSFQTYDTSGNVVEEMSGVRNVPVWTQIESRESVVRVINATGGIYPAFVQVRSW